MDKVICDDVIIAKVVEVLNTTIHNANINVSQIDEDLTKFGMDSLIFIRTVVLLEEKFKIQFPDSYLFMEKMNTLNKITNSIKSIVNIHESVENN